MISIFKNWLHNIVFSKEKNNQNNVNIEDNINKKENSDDEDVFEYVTKESLKE